MKKRILFCIPDYSAFKTPLTIALEKRGFDVKHFDFYKGNLLTRAIGFSSNQLYLPKKIALPLYKSLIQKQLLTIARDWRPSLLLVIKGDTISISTLEQLAKWQIPTINWYPEWLVVWDWIKIYAPHYTYFVSSCADVAKKLHKLHPRAFQLSYATAPDKQINRTAVKKYSLTFVGQHSKRRENYFRPLKKLGLRIWGYTNWQKSRLSSIAKPAVSVSETLDIFRQSKIVVNILTGNDAFQPKNVNNRTFEVLGVGSFLLNHDQPILHKHFPVNNCMVTYQTPQELYQKAKYYLQHEIERERIAQQGWDYVCKHHNYDIRLQELFSKIKI